MWLIRSQDGCTLAVDSRSSPCKLAMSSTAPVTVKSPALQPMQDEDNRIACPDRPGRRLATMKNKRNYYRLLFVQMDAPASVIKSTYRTMMQKLRLHPDLGGDERMARALNEAKDVLLDPVRRAEYDQQLIAAGYSTDRHRKSMQRGSGAGGTPDQGFLHGEEVCAAADAANVTPETTVWPCLPDRREKCPFCRQPIIWQNQPQSAYPTRSRCTRCDSPLAAIDADYPALANELRLIHRSYFECCARVWTAWPLDSGNDATVRDWSTLGCSIEVAADISLEQRVLLQSPGFAAVAVVRHQREEFTDRSVFGLEFLTLDIHLQAGSIHSTIA